MLQWASRLEVGDALFDFGEGQPLSGRFTETELEDLMFGRRPRPNAERIEKGIVILNRLLSHTTGEHRLPLLVILAWLNWALGRGSAAVVLLKHAVSINPRYGMTEVVRPIHVAMVDTLRPVLVLTREGIRPYLSRVTVAAITSTSKGLPTEVSVGSANGLDYASVISCDNISTIPVAHLGKQIGFLLPAQEALLAEAIAAAFDLE